MNEISPKIVRVWFDTILNPIIEGLNIEFSFLKKNNLTWRGFNNTFEALKPVRTFFHYRYYANFDHLVAYHPIVQDNILLHDESLLRLSESCYNLYHQLKDSQLLKNNYDYALQSYFEANPKIDDYKKDNLIDNDNLKYIAEYILNGNNELDSAYTLSPLWNPNIILFKNILNNDEFNLLLSNQKEAINNFNNSLNSCLNSIKSLRYRLSSQYGEPLVMPEMKELSYA